MKLYICEERVKEEVTDQKFFKSIEAANKYAIDNYRWMKNVEKSKDFCFITGMVDGDFPEDIDITNSTAIYECNGDNYDICNCVYSVRLDYNKMYSTIAKKQYDDILDAVIDLESELLPYQVDLYLYRNGSLFCFENPGGNSWLNDDHCVIWSTDPCADTEAYEGKTKDEIKEAMWDNRELYDNLLDNKIDDLIEKEEGEDIHV